jgi:hypothetical protein
MVKNQIIENTIKKASKKFQYQLKRYWPAEGNNGFNERNLSFLFANSFLSRPGACSFMEVPFLNGKSNRYDQRFDAYVFDKKIGIIIECKRLHQVEKHKEILKDLKRMNKNNVNKILRRHKNNSKPKSIYALIIAESWSPNINNWWINGSSEKLEWKHSEHRESMVYDIIKVAKRNQTLYWLYCYRKIE